jgi:Xaa-Pro aminopeptidase
MCCLNLSSTITTWIGRSSLGEVVRLDLGCDFRMYKGDFGRTIQVLGHFDGHFDDGQRETTELWNAAYLAGVSQLPPGRTPQDVYQTTLGYVQEHQAELKSATAKAAARKLPEATQHAVAWYGGRHGGGRS